MENARLITETREALEQQTATAEVLGVINSSPGDLRPVFDAMLEKALALCGASFGSLQTYDAGLFETVAAKGDPGFVERLRSVGRLPLSRGVTHQRIADGAHVVHLVDILEDPVYLAGNPSLHATVEQLGVRTVLTIALRRDDEVLGQISIYRREVRPFADKQIALLQNFAAQAVIAMENARLITETREALEQQTATAEVLGVINSSPGDLTPVFDAMLEKALRLCEASFGIMFTVEGESTRIVADHDVPEGLRDFLARNPPAIGPRIASGETAVQIADITADAVYSSRNAARRALADLGGARTTVWVALRKEGALLGVVAIYRRNVRPFSDKQIALLQNFAAQAVIAIENAHLITETREALEQQTATAEVLGVINSSPGDLAPVFDAMLGKALRLCEATYGQLSTYDGHCFDVVAIQGEHRWAEWIRQRGPAHPEAGTTIGRIVAGERVVHVEDITTEEAYLAGNPTRRALAEIGGFRTLLSVALRRDETVIGVLHIYRPEVRPFTDKQIALLQNFAAQAVIAMENARLLGELRQRTDEVAELNRGLEARVAEQVDELGRVGRLKRFLAPQLAELIVSQGDEKILESHRQEIVVVFCDLRGYTAFTETAEPEEVLAFLREYHGALGPLVAEFEGTLDQFSGDGIMVFFNDPVPIPDPAERAVKMAVAMREAAGALIADWRLRDRELGFGAGISQGYATLGQIGFAERSGYTAIGTVCNLAARLCAEAKDGQILIAGRVAAAVGKLIALEDLGSLALKGLTQPVSAFNVPLAASQPALRVIDGGPQSV
jgi:adenylate cyclase